MGCQSILSTKWENHKFLWNWLWILHQDAAGSLGQLGRFVPCLYSGTIADRERSYYKVLSSYLTQTYRTTNPLTGKSIIELGSGTGLVGLIAGKLDASCRVYITDQASVILFSSSYLACLLKVSLSLLLLRPLLGIMTENVKLNSLEENVHVAEFNWSVSLLFPIQSLNQQAWRGGPIPGNLPSQPDIILAADCVYFEPAFPLLVQTLVDLSNTATHVLFCYKKRRKVGLVRTIPCHLYSCISNPMGIEFLGWQTFLLVAQKEVYLDRSRWPKSTDIQQGINNALEAWEDTWTGSNAEEEKAGLKSLHCGKKRDRMS